MIMENSEVLNKYIFLKVNLMAKKKCVKDRHES